MEQLVFCGYGPALTLVAIFIARNVILSRGLLRDVPFSVKAATACLVIGLLPLSIGILQAAIQIAFVCFNSCPNDVAGAIQRILLTNLSLGLLCFAGWVFALYSLARAHTWRLFSLALLSLPLAVAASALMLSASSAHGEIVPVAQDMGWLYTLNYAVLPTALCWPLGTLFAMGLQRQLTAYPVEPAM